MSDVSNLLKRIDTTIATVKEKIGQQQPLPQDLTEQQKRLQRFEQTRDQVSAIARPRLEALARVFGDQIKITPKLSQTRAAVTLDFKSSRAFVTLTFAIVPDREMQKVVVTYDLDITPVLMMYESHAEFWAPIDDLKSAALETWLDDWIVKFVELYTRMHESDLYHGSEYVEDPIERVRFPKFAAGATLQHNGTTYYFINDRTRDDFARQHGLAVP
jgi:hypothetical protein